MSNYVEVLSIGDDAPEEVNVFVENPRGSVNKYEYDEGMGAIVLDRVLHSPFIFPADYGFIPQTAAEDGDPLDVFVLTDSPVYPGIVEPVRPIGVLDMEDEKGQDEKILAVPRKNPRYAEVSNLEDASRHILNEISHFLEEYKKLEGEKWTEVRDWHNKEKAHQLITEAQQRFKE